MFSFGTGTCETEAALGNAMTWPEEMPWRGGDVFWGTDSGGTSKAEAED